MTFIANKDKVFIKQLPPETHTASGLVIPDNVQKNQLYGTVVYIGKYNIEEYGELSIGDKISFSQYAGEKIIIDDEELLMLSPNDIYSIVVGDSHFAFGPSVIVKIEKKYRDKVSLENGLELHLDPLYKPTEHITYSGIVASVPSIIPYSERNDKITPVINIGDKVYFRYASVDEEKNYLGKSVNDLSETITLRVFYSWVYAVVKDDKVQAVGEWVLGKPFIDADGVDVEIQGESGPVTIKVEYFPGSTLIKSSHTEKTQYKAIVEYASNFEGESIDFKKGDIIFCKHRIDFENTIEGEQYYCFRHSKVDAVLGNIECGKCKDKLFKK